RRTLEPSSAHRCRSSTATPFPLPRSSGAFGKPTAWQEGKDAGTCHVRRARSGCHLDVCALSAPATSFAGAGGSPRCGLVRRIRSVAHVSELPAAAPAFARVAAVRRAGPPHRDPHVRAAQLGLADRTDPARPARRHAARRPSRLSRVLVGGFGGTVLVAG